MDMLGLGIGIELDISGIGDLEWAPAAEGCPDEEEAHAAAASASALTPMAPRNTEPGRERPGDENLDMGRPLPVPAPLTGTVTDGFQRRHLRRPGSGADCIST
jgi:hypothetical protein